MIETMVQGWVCGALWWPIGAMTTKAICESVSNERSTLVSYVEPVDLLDGILLRHGGDFCGGASFTRDSVIIVRSVVHTFKGSVTRENIYPITNFPSLSPIVSETLFACDMMCFDLDSVDA